MPCNRVARHSRQHQSSFEASLDTLQDELKESIWDALRKLGLDVGNVAGCEAGRAREYLVVDLTQSGKDGEVALERVLAEKHLKARPLFVAPSFPVCVDHRDLIQVGQQQAH